MGASAGADSILAGTDTDFGFMPLRFSLRTLTGSRQYATRTVRGSAAAPGMVSESHRVNVATGGVHYLTCRP